MMLQPVAKFMFSFLSLVCMCNTAQALSVSKTEAGKAYASVMAAAATPLRDITVGHNVILVQKFRAAVTEFQDAFDALLVELAERYPDVANTHMIVNRINTVKYNEWMYGDYSDLGKAVKKLKELTQFDGDDFNPDTFSTGRAAGNKFLASASSSGTEKQDDYFVTQLVPGLYRGAAVKQIKFYSHNCHVFDPLLSQPRPQYELVLNENATKVQSVVLVGYERSSSAASAVIDPRTSYFIMGGFWRKGAVFRGNEADIEVPENEADIEVSEGKKSAVYRIHNKNGMVLTPQVEIAGKSKTDPIDWEGFNFRSAPFFDDDMNPMYKFYVVNRTRKLYRNYNFTIVEDYSYGYLQMMYAMEYDHKADTFGGAILKGKKFAAWSPGSPKKK